MIEKWIILFINSSTLFADGVCNPVHHVSEVFMVSNGAIVLQTSVGCHERKTAGFFVIGGFYLDAKQFCVDTGIGKGGREN
jgi:hypothetical protein